MTVLAIQRKNLKNAFFIIEKLWKKHFLAHIFKIHLRCNILQSLKIPKLFVLKWRPYPYIMQNAKRWPVLLLFSLSFDVKLYEVTINFQYKFCKFISRSTVFPSFMMCNLLVLKWRSFQYNKKFEKEVVFIIVFIRLLLKTLKKIFNTNF